VAPGDLLDRAAYDGVDDGAQHEVARVGAEMVIAADFTTIDAKVRRLRGCRSTSAATLAVALGIGDTAWVGEWTNSLRVREAQVLDAMYAAIAATGRGRTMFVAGDDRGGRSALLHDWVSVVEGMRPRPRVLGGVFEEGVYAPWARDRTAASDALGRLEGLLSVGESVISLSELVLPAAITQLLGQVLSKLRARRRLTSPSARSRRLAGQATRC